MESNRFFMGFSDTKILNILRISTALMFLGRAWENIRWIGPYRDFFYNPIGFGKWYANCIDRDLADIYNDHFYENLIICFSAGVGVVFVLSALVLFFYKSGSHYRWVIYVGMFFLLTMFLGFFMGKHLNMWGMLFEHTAQFMLPLLFIWYASGRKRLFYKYGSWAIAITFLCHGLFAVGYYPQPGNFADMMIVGLGIQEDTARYWLLIIGYIDFIFAAIVIMPYSWVNSNKVLSILVQFFLLYGIVWGGVTAYARIYTSYQSGMFLHWLDQYALEFLVRIPHFIIPLVLLYTGFKKRLNKH